METKLARISQLSKENTDKIWRKFKCPILKIVQIFFIPITKHTIINSAPKNKDMLKIKAFVLLYAEFIFNPLHKILPLYIYF